MTSSHEIINILYKRLAGSPLTADETTRLEEWLAENPEARRRMADSLEDFENLVLSYKTRSLIDTDRPKMEMERRLGLTADTPRTRTWKTGVLKWSAAAGIAALLTAGAVMLFRSPSSEPQPIAEAVSRQPLRIENLTPGGTRAVVTTSKGDTLHITASTTAVPPLAKAEDKGPLCIDVPRGGEFVVTLEDSTRVWLNSESRLVYPPHFSASSRRVELTGEAYFEVTHDPDVPFIVESANQRVRVYGTEFNIRSYPEDNAVYTTLSSGSISLAPISGGGEIFLSPGKQAVFTKESSEAKVRSVDIDRVTGWRHGRFVFEEQSLRQIMRDLARWYDFDYQFADDDAAETIFMGSIPRYSNFKTAIVILEKSGGLSFEVKDDKILISRKKS